MSLRITGAPPTPTPPLRRAEASRRPVATPVEAPGTPLPAVPDPPALYEAGSAAGGAAMAVPAMVPDQARLAAELVRQDVLAQPPQASGIHGNLVAATVLNLLA
jgi:hypothetical protein